MLEIARTPLSAVRKAGAPLTEQVADLTDGLAGTITETDARFDDTAARFDDIEAVLAELICGAAADEEEGE